MYCKRCYTKLEEDWKNCPKCSAIIKEENIEYEEEKVKELEKKEKKRAVIYFLVFLLFFICMVLLNNVGGIFFVISLITIVAGYINCPNSKLIKIAFWTFLILVVLSFIAMIILLIMCGQMFVGCISSCGV